jgi:predicted ABC-type ATPase
VLRDALQVIEFVNADAIAAGLAGFAPERAAISAGRIMLARLKDLASQNANFAFETTMASRSFAPFLQALRERQGYEFTVVFMYLRSADLAVRRVSSRVRKGGHSIPDDVIRRRYHRGLQNLRELYLPIADQYRVYDNSRFGDPRLVAIGRYGRTTTFDERTWQRIMESSNEAE